VSPPDDLEQLAKEAVKRVVLASAPEIAADLKRFWDEYAPYCTLVDDRPGVTLDAGPCGIVRFSHRTMLQFWLLSFASWKALDAYMMILQLTKSADGHIRLRTADLDTVPGQPEANADYAEAIARIKHLNQLQDISAFPWPPSVPYPSAASSLASPPDRAAYDLACIATGFAFLHEMQHIRLRAKNSPADPIDEELECDRFARETLLEQTAQYAAANAYSEEAVRIKRSLGIALSLYYGLVLTPATNRRGSKTHPPTARRFLDLLTAIGDLPPGALFWSWLSSVLAAHLKLEGNLPLELDAESDKALCFQLVDVIGIS